jgi:hypothetical protein
MNVATSGMNSESSELYSPMGAEIPLALSGRLMVRRDTQGFEQWVELTWILNDTTLCPELLLRDFGVLWEDEDVPVEVSHCDSGLLVVC